MRAIAKHMYFERRRLILAGLLAFVAGIMLNAHLSSMAFGLPFPIFTGLLYVFFVILAATMTTYFIPNLRWLTDCVAMSRLGFAIWVVDFHGQEVASLPFMSALIVVVGAMCLLRLTCWVEKISDLNVLPIKLFNVINQIRVVLFWIDNKETRELGAFSDTSIIGSAAVIGHINDGSVAA
ncbi:MAG: hypothetical protein ACJAY6_001630 [Yoonia sp.]|jgi:hypothetical protein